jgi:molybdopterin molybdotransferase
VETEMVPTYQASDRVTAETVLAPEHLPAFPRSTMDGYAVRARDTFGASESLPAYLEVVGEVHMGSAPDITLAAGQATVAYTGGMLAHSADAVVMGERFR